MSLSEDQLKAMEAGAPLLVAEVRRLKAALAEVLSKAQEREAQAYALGWNKVPPPWATAGGPA